MNQRALTIKSNDNTVFCTSMCNNRCIMCCQPPQPHNDIDELYRENVERIKNAPKDLPLLCLTGGEPTLLGEKLISLIKANTGRIQSDETKDKISKANGTIVLQFSLKGEFISEYQSASKAAQQINKTCASITNQCKGITKKCGNYLFVYKKDYDVNPSIIEDKIKDLSNRKTAAKPIIQLTINGDIIKEWPSTTEAAKQLGVAISSINNCLRGINKTCKNSKWIYK